jgi:hypothetical protein
MGFSENSINGIVTQHPAANPDANFIKLTIAYIPLAILVLKRK